jgi:2-polyprenyl-3-methyl-5-hydroxy-6-metoxy-1,4-benzoquinol methylase
MRGSSPFVEAAVRAACPGCGEPGQLLYQDLRDLVYGVDGRWGFARCTVCGTLWLDPVPAPEDESRLYPESYGPHHSPGAPEATLPRWLQRERAWQAAIQSGFVAAVLGYDQLRVSRRARLIGRVIGPFRPLRDNAAAMIMFAPRVPGRLLDVGCGEGSFIALMASLGWDVSGVEPNPAAARTAARRVGGAVFCATVEDAHLPAASYDLVTMSHVLEHLRDPERALRKVRTLLRPGGRLVITTPNVGSLGHRLFRGSWRPLEPPRHLTLFTGRSLRKVVEKSGLTVLYAASLTRTAWWVAAQSAFIRRGAPVPPVERIVPGWGSRAFAILETIAALVWREAGEELLIVAQQPEGGAAP